MNQAQLNKEFIDHVNQLEFAWNANDVQLFLNTNHTLNVIFTNKMQELIKERNVTYQVNYNTDRAAIAIEKLNQSIEKTLQQKEKLTMEINTLEDRRLHITLKKNNK